MIFQSYALWPHMTVAQNVAFGLEERRRPRAEIEAALAVASPDRLLVAAQALREGFTVAEVHAMAYPVMGRPPASPGTSQATIRPPGVRATTGTP